LGKVKYLAEKSCETIAEEGVTEFIKKTGRYLFKVKPKTYQSCKDILFINGCWLSHPARYRVEHQMEQLNANGISSDMVFYEDLNVKIEKFYRAFVFFRCPITNTIKEFIEKAKYNNKVVFYDIDDLVFDEKYTKTIKYLQTLSKEELDNYYDGVKRMKETLKLCDYATTSTETLSNELKKYVKETYINRNVASEKMLELSLNAIKKVKRDENKIILGYLSGSITHNADFELIFPVIKRLMSEKENVYLKLVGELDIPEGLKEFENRVIIEKFIEWQKLPDLIASIDINLAPLEESLFNNAKSENKWTEASLVKVVTIASDVGAFKVINNNIDGILCENTEKDWYNKLKNLIENKDLRTTLGNNAFERTRKNYISTYSGYHYAKYIKSKLTKSLAFVLPTTNISGGVNVIIKHCHILRKHGFDVFIINMDNNEQNIINNEGEINVITAEETNKKSKIICNIDTLVASLWSTLYYCLKYPNKNNISYLVQNFETDFMKYGNYMKQVANSTYSFNNVNYLTISKWCKSWLENDFEREVKSALNGINLEKFPFHKRDFKGKIKILIEGNSSDYYKNVDESFKIVEELDKNKYEIHYLSYQGEPKKWYYVDKFLHKVPYDEVGKIYASCDILIKSSILESFSYPPLEMMATGGIVIVVPNDGNKEYLRDNVNCLFYERGNIKEAIAKIEQIRKDKNLREKLINEGLKTAKNREWSKIEKEIINLYTC